jgi:hypothetical protein
VGKEDMSREERKRERGKKLKEEYNKELHKCFDGSQNVGN